MIINATIRNAESGFFINGGFEGRTFEAGSVNGNGLILYAVNVRTTELEIDLSTLTLENTTGADVTPVAIQDRAALLSTYTSKKKVSSSAAGNVNPDHIFANAAARDSYFSTRFDELVTGLEIVLEDNGSGDRVLQRWLGESSLSSYPASPSDFWHDVGGAALTALEVKTLNESNAQTNALIDSKLDILNLLTLINGSINSSVSWLFPAGTVSVGGFDINSANHTLGGVNSINGLSGLAIIQVYDTNTGSTNPVIYDFGAANSTNVLQPIDDTVQVNPSETFSITVPTDYDFRLWQGTYVKPNEIGDFTFVASATDLQNQSREVATGSITFLAGDIGFDTLVQLDNNIILNSGEVLSVTVSGAKLRGTLLGGQFVPRFTPLENLGTYKPLATREYVEEQVGRTKIAVPSDITITTANLATYNRKTLYSTAISETSITISENLDIDYFDFVATTSSSVRIITTGAERINGETDIRFTEFEGGRIQKVDGNYYLVFDNTDPDMTDNYVESASLADGTLTMSRTGSLADVTVDLSPLSVVGADPRYRAKIALSGDLTINAANVATYDGALVYIPQGAATTRTVTMEVDLNFDFIDFVNSSQVSSVNLILDPDGSARIDGSTNSITFDNYEGGRLIDEPNAGYSYSLIYSSLTNPATGQHPVVLTRDTPSLASLATIANESLNDNSGLWVLANNQVLSTESSVDASIMIRAQKTGLLDVNNAEIPTTSIQKNGVVLQAGTVVRVFSSTDLRVVSTPTISPQAAMYPDLTNLTVSPLDLSGVEAVYNLHKNRTTILTDSATTGTSAFQVYLPSLQDALDLGWVNRSDVFGFRNDRTDALNLDVRTFQVGTSFSSDGSSTISVLPGQTLFVSPAPSGSVWQVLSFGQSSAITTETISLNTDWYRDANDSTAVDNRVSMHLRKSLTDGVVREHIQSSSYANNPVAIRFRRRSVNDDIAWILFWSTYAPNVPALGTVLEVIEANIPTALSYIETNINSGYDLDLSDPLATMTISYITHVSGSTLKVGVVTALASHLVVNDTLTIQGNSVAANNGDWAIDSIYPDRLALDITVSGSSVANNTGASGFITRAIFADCVLVSHTLRQINMNLYHNAARTALVTAIPTEWFNITDSPAPVGSMLTIGYNTGISIVEPVLAILDDTETPHLALGGARGSTFYFDNYGANYQNVRYLPLSFEELRIRTDGTCNFYMDIHPQDLPVGEQREYNIASNILNDDDDVNFNIGRVGGVETSDEGLTAVSIRNGYSQKITMYNDGVNHGWRLSSPFSRRMPSFGSTTVTTPVAGTVPISLSEIVASQNEDPSFYFMAINNNRFIMYGAFDYELEMTITLRFDGVEDTGLSFVNCALVPVLLRNAVSSDITQATGSTNATLFFLRNGNSADDDTKPIVVLNARVRHQAQQNDEMSFELRFGTFPTGYSISNLRQVHTQYSIQVTGGID